MSVTGGKLPRSRNSTVVPTASPQARPRRQPRCREIWFIVGFLLTDILSEPHWFTAFLARVALYGYALSISSAVEDIPRPIYSLEAAASLFTTATSTATRSKIINFCQIFPDKP